MDLYGLSIINIMKKNIYLANYYTNNSCKDKTTKFRNPFLKILSENSLKKYNK